MPDDFELARNRTRLAWWLRACRLADPRDPTLAQVAIAAGLSKGSGSVVSLWETNRSVNPPKLEQLQRLARFYGVPLTLFTEPPETDAERLARYRRLALEALAEEQSDWEAGSGPSPEAGPGGGPLRRLA
jgi:transcriptional regulator with XRE-family HTH domain